MKTYSKILNFENDFGCCGGANTAKSLKSLSCPSRWNSAKSSSPSSSFLSGHKKSDFEKREENFFLAVILWSLQRNQRQKLRVVNS